MKGYNQEISDEDSGMVSLCKKGDIEAFEILVRKYEKKMLNVAYRMTGNYEEACEIVQDAFLSAYKGMRHFEGKSRFSTWLTTIVMNLSRNRLRQLRIQDRHEGPSLQNPVLTEDGTVSMELAGTDPPVDEVLEKREVHERVRRCIDTLNMEYREVLILRDIQGFSYDEIRDMLTIAEGTVKSRLARGREALKDCLKKVIGEL